MSSSDRVSRELTPPPHLFCLARHCDQCEAVHPSCKTPTLRAKRRQRRQFLVGGLGSCKRLLRSGLRVGLSFSPWLGDESRAVLA